MTSMDDYSYYAIVTFGSPTYGRQRSYYRSLTRAIEDARTLGGGSLTTVRVVGVTTRTAALDADISDPLPVVWEV